MSFKSKLKALSRRDVLVGIANFAWLAPLALSLGELLKFLSFEPPITQATRFTLGSSATLPILPAYFEQGQIWLHQDEKGYFAIDAICTHLGCTVRLQQSTDDYYCRCHGSRFALDGEVTHGPATVPLRFVHLEWDADGRVVVERAQEVNETFRLSAT